MSRTIARIAESCVATKKFEYFIVVCTSQVIQDSRYDTSHNCCMVIFFAMRDKPHVRMHMRIMLYAIRYNNL